LVPLTSSLEGRARKTTHGPMKLRYTEIAQLAHPYNVSFKRE